MYLIVGSNKADIEIIINLSPVIDFYFFAQPMGIKFIYSEKATKFCEIFLLLLTVCTVVKSKRKISHFVGISEYINFKRLFSLDMNF